VTVSVNTNAAGLVQLRPPSGGKRLNQETIALPPANISNTTVHYARQVWSTTTVLGASLNNQPPQPAQVAAAMMKSGKIHHLYYVEVWEYSQTILGTGTVYFYYIVMGD